MSEISEWKCFKCKVDIEEVDDVQIRYKDIELPDAPGYRCPQCGLTQLTEFLVTGELADAEEMLQAK